MNDDIPIGCTITFACDSWQPNISGGAAIEDAVGAALRAADHVVDAPVELAVVLADDGLVQSHNRDFRGKDVPTNVLAFAQTNTVADIRPFEHHDGEPIELGDVIIAYETVTREAQAAEISLEAHLLHLVIHGVLHLLGFDHQTDAEAGAMQKLEIQALAQLGLANPYAAELAAAEY